MCVCGDLAGNYDEAGRDECLTGDAARLIRREYGVEDGVGYLIRDLIRVALCDRFGSEKVAARVAQVFRLLEDCF
jgi:hypothetical protein